MEIIAVANQKGGVCKTTTVHALAAGLKQRGYKVLTVDMDPQGNLSDSAGADSYNLPTMYELLKREAGANKVVQHLDMFDIMPANILLAGLEQEMNEIGKEHRLSESLEGIKHEYDYIIIDTPPSLGVLTVNSFTAADKVIIPTTAGVFAVKGILQLSNTIATVKKYCNKRLKIDGILITKYNPRININKDVKALTEEISSKINTKVYKTYIRSSVVVEESQAQKADIFSYAASSTVAEDYNSFIDEFLAQGVDKDGCKEKV